MSTPKDSLKVKLGTPDQVFWTELREKIKNDLLNSRRQILVNEKILVFTAERIAKEKKHLNS